MANATTNIQRENVNNPRDANPGSQPRGSSFGAGVIDKTVDMASEASEKSKEAISTVVDRAKEIASYVEQKAENATSAVGSGMQSLAGGVDKASSAITDKLQSGGRYLQEHDLRGIGHDLTEVMRQHPWTAVMVGVGFGFLISRATCRG
jgi:ElaB/YqjD/DUF883 family membrane-anchored ribosome-binding protein